MPAAPACTGLPTLFAPGFATAGLARRGSRPSFFGAFAAMRFDVMERQHEYKGANWRPSLCQGLPAVNFYFWSLLAEETISMRGFWIPNTSQIILLSQGWDRDLLKMVLTILFQGDN